MKKLRYGARFDLLLGRRTYECRDPVRSLELVDTKAMPSGVMLNSYKVAGPVKTGTMPHRT